jgi:hypothetical protein
MPDGVHISERDRTGVFRLRPEEELAQPAPVEPQFDETLDQLRVRVESKVGKVSHERTLKAPHRLIRGIVAEQEKRQSAHKLRTGHLLAEPDFSSAFERRRLRVLSSLFTALEKFGAQPWIHDAETRKTGAIVGAMSVSFLLDHPAAKPDRDGRWRTREGWADELRLSLVSDEAHSWSDAEDHGLEARLTEIVVQVILAGEVSYRAAARASYERTLSRRRELEAELVRRQEEAARKARETAIAAEKERRTQLLTMAADLRAADDIRSLVARVMARNAPDAEGASRWAEWALSVAEQLDPTGRNPLRVPDAR